MRRSPQTFGLVLALSTFGCGTNGIDQDAWDEAAAALEEARASQADRYAPASYRRAEEAHRVAGGDGEADGEDTERTVEEIQSMAKHATQEAEALREKAKTVAHENIQEATLLLEIARAVARHQTAANGFESHELETMQRELDLAQETFETEDYARAGLLASGVIQQVVRLERHTAT